MPTLTSPREKHYSAANVGGMVLSFETEVPKYARQLVQGACELFARNFPTPALLTVKVIKNSIVRPDAEDRVVFGYFDPREVAIVLPGLFIKRYSKTIGRDDAREAFLSIVFHELYHYHQYTEGKQFREQPAHRYGNRMAKEFLKRSRFTCQP